MARKTELSETAQCLCLASRRAARAITGAFDRELRGHGLRATQFTLLAALSLRGEQTISELAAFIEADRTTMTRNVALATARSLVSVRPADGDRRVRLVSITAAGRDVLAGALSSWSKVQAAITEQIGIDAADGLRHLAAKRSTRDALPQLRAQEQL